jgi:hypothetical protein
VAEPKVAFENQDAFERNAAAMRWVETLRRSMPGGGPPGGDLPPREVGTELVVRVTQEVTSPEGYYFGVILERMEGGTWLETDQVLVEDLHGLALAKDEFYKGTLTGDEEGLPLVTVGGSANTTSLSYCRSTFIGLTSEDCLEFRVPLRGLGVCSNVQLTPWTPMWWDDTLSSFVGKTKITTAAGATLVTAFYTEAGELQVGLTPPAGPMRTMSTMGCYGAGMEYAAYSPVWCNETWVTGCTACPPGAPKRFTFTVAGAPTASKFNGAWELVNDGSGCVWTSTVAGCTVTYTKRTAAEVTAGSAPADMVVATADGKTLNYTVKAGTDPGCCGPANMVLTGTVPATGEAGTSWPDLPILVRRGPCAHTPCSKNYLSVQVRCKSCGAVGCGACVKVGTAGMATASGSGVTYPISYWQWDSTVQMYVWGPSGGAGVFAVDPDTGEVWHSGDLADLHAGTRTACACSTNVVAYTGAVPFTQVTINYAGLVTLVSYCGQCPVFVYPDPGHPCPEGGAHAFAVTLPAGIACPGVTGGVPAGDVLVYMFAGGDSGGRRGDGNAGGGLPCYIYKVGTDAYFYLGGTPGSQLAYWKGTWACCAPMAMALQAGSACTGLPATVTATPWNSSCYPSTCSSGGGGSLFSASEARQATVRRQLEVLETRVPCRHEGVVTEACQSSTGKAAELRHVRECDLYGSCTYGSPEKGHQVCLGCKDYDPDPNLLPPESSS